MLPINIKPISDNRSCQRAGSPLLSELLPLFQKSCPWIKIISIYTKFLPLCQNGCHCIQFLSKNSCPCSGLNTWDPTLVRCLGPGAENLLCKKLFLAARFLIRKARFSEPVFGILQEQELSCVVINTTTRSIPVVIDKVCEGNGRKLEIQAGVRFQSCL